MAATKEDVRNSVVLELTRCFVNAAKRLKQSWRDTKEADQETVLRDIDATVRLQVRKLVGIIAADGRPSLSGLVDQVVVKDGIKAVVKLSKGDAARHELADAQGRNVLIVITNDEKFTSGPALKAEKDQKTLALPDPNTKADDKKEVKKDPRTKRGPIKKN